MLLTGQQLVLCVPVAPHVIHVSFCFYQRVYKLRKLLRGYYSVAALVSSVAEATTVHKKRGLCLQACSAANDIYWCHHCKHDSSQQHDEPDML